MIRKCHLMYDIDLVRKLEGQRMDPLSLDNIDSIEDWIAGEPKFVLLIEQDVNWTSIQEPLSTVTLENDDVLDKDDNDNNVVLTNASTHVFYGLDVNPYDRWE